MVCTMSIVHVRPVVVTRHFHMGRDNVITGLCSPRRLLHCGSAVDSVMSTMAFSTRETFIIRSASSLIILNVQYFNIMHNYLYCQAYMTVSITELLNERESSSECQTFSKKYTNTHK